jgi:hypothetical protein
MAYDSIMETLWDLLERVSLFPKKSHPKHLLWVLNFLKVCPKKSPRCWAIGVSAGAVDPKMHYKCVCAFIDAIENLVDLLVSISSSQCEDSKNCVNCLEDNSTIHL